MSQNAIQIINRLKEELSIKTDKNLCQLLDIKPNTLSTWKKRETLDFNKVIALCKDKNLDLNYIFFEERDKTSEVNHSNTTADQVPSSAIQPEAKLFDEFKLVNTNRNIALFQTKHSYHPIVKENTIVIGQKIRKNQTTDGVLYIIEFETEEIIIDELQKVTTNKTTQEFKLKNFHPFNHTIEPKNNIKHIWQYIDAVPNLTVE